MSFPNSPRTSSSKLRPYSFHQPSKPIRFIRNSQKTSTNFDKSEKNKMRTQAFEQNYIKINSKCQEDRCNNLMKKSAIFETPKSRDTENLKEEEFFSSKRSIIVHKSQKFFTNPSLRYRAHEKFNLKISSFQSNLKETSFQQKTAKRQSKISKKQDSLQFFLKEQNTKLKQELKKKQQENKKLMSQLHHEQKMVKKSNEKILNLKTSLIEKQRILQEAEQALQKYRQQNDNLSKQLEEFMMESRIVTEKDYELGQQETRENVEQSQLFPTFTQQLQQEIHNQNSYIYQLRRTVKQLQIKERVIRMMYEKQLKQMQRDHNYRYDQVVKRFEQTKLRDRCTCSKKRYYQEVRLEFSPE